MAAMAMGVNLAHAEEGATAPSVESADDTCRAAAKAAARVGTDTEELDEKSNCENIEWWTKLGQKDGVTEKTPDEMKAMLTKELNDPAVDAFDKDVARDALSSDENLEHYTAQYNKDQISDYKNNEIKWGAAEDKADSAVDEVKASFAEQDTEQRAVTDLNNELSKPGLSADDKADLLATKNDPAKFQEYIDGYKSADSGSYKDTIAANNPEGVSAGASGVDEAGFDTVGVRQGSMDEAGFAGTGGLTIDGAATKAEAATAETTGAATAETTGVATPQTAAETVKGSDQVRADGAFGYQNPPVAGMDGVVGGSAGSVADTSGFATTAEAKTAEAAPATTAEAKTAEAAPAAATAQAEAAPTTGFDYKSVLPTTTPAPEVFGTQQPSLATAGAPYSVDPSSDPLGTNKPATVDATTGQVDFSQSGQALGTQQASYPTNPTDLNLKALDAAKQEQSDKVFGTQQPSLASAGTPYSVDPVNDPLGTAKPATVDAATGQVDFSKSGQPLTVDGKTLGSTNVADLSLRAVGAPSAAQLDAQAAAAAGAQGAAPGTGGNGGGGGTPNPSIIQKGQQAVQNALGGSGASALQSLQGLMGMLKGSSGSSASPAAGTAATTVATQASQANAQGCYYNTSNVEMCPAGTTGTSSVGCAVNTSTGVNMCPMASSTAAAPAATPDSSTLYQNGYLDGQRGLSQDSRYSADANYASGYKAGAALRTTGVVGPNGEDASDSAVLTTCASDLTPVADHLGVTPAVAQLAFKNSSTLTTAEATLLGQNPDVNNALVNMKASFDDAKRDALYGTTYDSAKASSDPVYREGFVCGQSLLQK